MISTSLRTYLFPLVLCAISASHQALAQVSVYPGTDEYFGPDTIDGSFDDKIGDCDSPTNLCGTNADTGAGEVYTYSAALFNTTQISTTVSGLYKEFTVPSVGDTDTLLDARITGGASWRGSFYIVDFTKIAFINLPSLGAKAEGFVRVSLVDVTDPGDPFDVGNDAIEDFGCEPDREIGGKIPLPLVSDGIDIGAEIGWCEEDRSETFSFGAKVIPGHTYQIQLAMVCQSTTGVPLTFASVCVFNNTVNSDFNLADELDVALDKLGDELSDLSISLGTIKLPDISVDLPGWIRSLCDVAGEDCDSINVNLPDIALPDIPLPVADIIDSFLSPMNNVVVNALAPSIDKGFMSWDYMNVTIDPDLTALVGDAESDILGQVASSTAAITAAVDTVSGEVEVVRTGVADSIRLLHTPNGKRSAGPIAGYPDLCGDGDCRWNKN